MLIYQKPQRSRKKWDTVLKILLNMSILNRIINRKINSIKTWSSRKAEFLSKSASFLRLKFEYENYIFSVWSISFTCYDPEEHWFYFFAEIMRRNYDFCCSSSISINPTSHLKLYLIFYQMLLWCFCFSFCYPIIICDALRNLVSFAQFKKSEKYPSRSVNFNKVAGFAFFKLYK